MTHHEPQDSLLRPVYFLRLISQSIREGEFITDKIYVSRYVWMQKEVFLPCVDKRIELYGLLLEKVKSLRILYSKDSLMENHPQIDTVINTAILMQNSLAQDFEFIVSASDAGIKKDDSAWNQLSQKIKTLTQKVSKGAQKIGTNLGFNATQNETLIHILFEMCKEVAFLEPLIIDLQKDPKKKNFLNKIAYISLFFNDVILKLTFNDMHLLLNKYLARVLRTITNKKTL